MTRGSKAIERSAVAVRAVPVMGAEVASQSWSELIARAARSNCTILITGETGVGKGHLAAWLHANSPRAAHPFVPVNCGAIPETIIDSQLFGHARGSFSGATTDHLGLVRAAEPGTLFLDEVSELPPSAQTRLLRLLQEREVQPVGRSTPIIVDVRVIAATNRELKQAVSERSFREDLLFRLDVIQLRVKPLRERRNELPDLLKAFNREFSGLYGQSPLAFDDGALRRLMTHAWPGNIRQLRTVLERLHVLCPGELITECHLVDPGQLTETSSIGSPAQMLDEARLQAVKRVLADSGGSIARAAKTFGVHRSTIYRWLKQG
jgi:two-component system response regulator PilR (NtrC family)/two-component system response regulator HydG